MSAYDAFYLLARQLVFRVSKPDDKHVNANGGSFRRQSVAAKSKGTERRQGEAGRRQRHRVPQAAGIPAGDAESAALRRMGPAARHQIGSNGGLKYTVKGAGQMREARRPGLWYHLDNLSRIRYNHHKPVWNYAQAGCYGVATVLLRCIEQLTDCEQHVKDTKAVWHLSICYDTPL